MGRSKEKPLCGYSFLVGDDEKDDGMKVYWANEVEQEVCSLEGRSQICRQITFRFKSPPPPL